MEALLINIYVTSWITNFKAYCTLKVKWEKIPAQQNSSFNQYAAKSVWAVVILSVKFSPTVPMALMEGHKILYLCHLKFIPTWWLCVPGRYNVFPRCDRQDAYKLPNTQDFYLGPILLDPSVQCIVIVHSLFSPSQGLEITDYIVAMKVTVRSLSWK